MQLYAFSIFTIKSVVLYYQLQWLLQCGHPYRSKLSIINDNWSTDICHVNEEQSRGTIVGLARKFRYHDLPEGTGTDQNRPEETETDFRVLLYQSVITVSFFSHFKNTFEIYFDIPCTFVFGVNG